MATTPENIAEKVEDLINESGADWRKGDLSAAIATMQDAWNTLPSPAEEYDESYLIAGYLIEMYTEHGDIESATKWAEILQRCDLERMDDGEREFIAGKVAYSAKNIDLAKEYFKTSFKKCEGRYFEGEDDIYLKLAAA
jgi:tetratricopeptide (TPR) repeat protein